MSTELTKPLRRRNRSGSSSPDENTGVGKSPPRPRSFYTRFAAAVRWLHIYISLLGFTALMLFAVTGITLNHPTWFGADAQHVAESKGTLDKAWLQLPGTTVTTADEEIDYTRQIDKLAVVEFLRTTHGVRGAVSDFRADEYECMVLFKGPAYAADAVIDRETGEYRLSTTVMGAVAVINDLHKGRDTGPVWSWVIDISATVMVFISITGFILLFYLKRKRFTGVVTAVVGTIIVAALYAFGVP